MKCHLLTGFAIWTVFSCVAGVLEWPGCACVLTSLNNLPAVWDPKLTWLLLTGIWAVHTDGHSGDAASCVGNRPRLHVRDAEAAADDHVGGRQGPHPDVPQFARPASLWRWRRPADVSDGFRRDGTYVQHRRRRAESKTASVLATFTTHGGWPTAAAAPPHPALPAAPRLPTPAPHDGPSASPRPVPTLTSHTLLQSGPHDGKWLPAAHACVLPLTTASPYGLPPATPPYVSFTPPAVVTRCSFFACAVVRLQYLAFHVVLSFLHSMEENKTRHRHVASAELLFGHRVIKTKLGTRCQPVRARAVLFHEI